MKAYRDDIRRHAIAEGRNPDDVKVMFLVTPVLGATDAEAQQKQQRLLQRPDFIEQMLALLSSITDIDFAKFDLDQTLPHLTTNGEQGTLDKFQQPGSGKTRGRRRLSDHHTDATHEPARLDRGDRWIGAGTAASRTGSQPIPACHAEGHVAGVLICPTTLPTVAGAARNDLRCSAHTSFRQVLDRLELYSRSGLFMFHFAWYDRSKLGVNKTGGRPPNSLDGVADVTRKSWKGNPKPE
jgi:alkanesulfonate monooxygenase SsuD/methylene tetrahydromethanopterin reductase-like flavin-dependent oxidoreductase (luciferase family)